MVWKSINSNCTVMKAVSCRMRAPNCGPKRFVSCEDRHRHHHGMCAARVSSQRSTCDSIEKPRMCTKNTKNAKNVKNAKNALFGFTPS